MSRRAAFRVERYKIAAHGYSDRFVRIDDDGDAYISKTGDDGDGAEIYVPRDMLGGMIGALNAVRQRK